jgi:hypothetical protein
MSRIRTWLLALIAIACPGATWVFGQGSPPPGYSVTKVSTGLTTDQVENISQMVFKPGDPNHVYAARYGFNNPATDTGVVTRYDYNATTGALSNPLNVASGLGLTLGLGFLGNDLYVSSTQNVFQNNSTGGIFRLQLQGNGTYGNAVEFVNNVPLGEHMIDQIQIVGNSLYVGIGTRTNDGSNETVYNGTIGKITDLTKANYAADGANNIALANVLTDTDPGKLHVYASGFRNPYGLRVDGSGNVSVTDNGADTPFLTPDYLYTHVPLGGKGIFPPPAPGATISPLANLGLDTSADGFDVIPSGPDQGKLLVSLFHSATAGSPPGVTGNQLVMVDPTTGAVTPFLGGLGNPLEVVQDPFGRLLVTDYGPSFYNNFDPNSGAVYLISASAVPEPGSLVLWLSALPVLVGVVVRSRRNDRRDA